MIGYLIPTENDGVKSFNDKARVEEYSNKDTLFSYTTKIASVDHKDNSLNILCDADKLSTTTRRHLYSFIEQEKDITEIEIHSTPIFTIDPGEKIYSKFQVSKCLSEYESVIKGITDRLKKMGYEQAMKKSIDDIYSIVESGRAVAEKAGKENSRTAGMSL